MLPRSSELSIPKAGLTTPVDGSPGRLSHRPQRQVGFSQQRVPGGRCGARGEGTVQMGMLDKAKDLLSQNADKIETAIKKAGDFVDDKTQGKYSDTIHKVQEEAKKVVDTGGQQS